tara:strand:+ start:37196 stop:37645 length:450 start_codon:yes stop_codon:yes gene_type:complete
MNNFLNNLNNREKKLIMAALLIVFIFVIFMISNNVLSALNLSNKKLFKAKDDYEYVFLKVEILNQAVTNSQSNIEDINLFLKNERSTTVFESEIISESDGVKVIFLTNNLKDSISVSNEISNKLNMKLQGVDYSKLENQAKTILFFSQL